LLPTQPGEGSSSSSDFDSSDSANDSSEDDAPSTSAKPSTLPKTSTATNPVEATEVPRFAESTEVPEAKVAGLPKRALPTGLGGALKKSVDGQAAVRVEPRRTGKKVGGLGWRSYVLTGIVARTEYTESKVADGGGRG
jgi:hypothetical protein